MKIITMTAYNRPDYTQAVLNALSKCEGASSWVFMPCVEPRNESVVSMIRKFDGCENRCTVNVRQLGLNRNTFQAIQRAVSLEPELIVHLEDDIVLSPDALVYFEWAIREIVSRGIKSKDGHHVSLACGYNKPASQPLEAQSYTCSIRPIFNCWGWGTNLRLAKWMLSEWCFKDPTRFTAPFRKGFKKTRREVYPTLSRVQNIGVLNGSNDTLAGRRAHRTPWVADLPVSEFTLES